MLAEKREKFKKIEEKIGKFFAQLKLNPNQYTFLSLIFAILTFYFLIKIKLIFSLIFFFLATFLDFVDGAVARFLKMETKEGAYLDTIFDRYVEGVILLGFLFLPLPDLFLPAKVWIFLAFFGSLMTTYSKAAAKEKELLKIELKKGLLGRGERIILIFLAIFLTLFNPFWTLYSVMILAILSNITALQRIYLSLH